MAYGHEGRLMDRRPAALLGFVPESLVAAAILAVLMALAVEAALLRDGGP
jgi:hypothetical protein